MIRPIPVDRLGRRRVGVPRAGFNDLVWPNGAVVFVAVSEVWSHSLFMPCASRSVANDEIPGAETTKVASQIVTGLTDGIAIVMESARTAGVEPRALAVRALLQLPRVGTHNGWIEGWQAQREVRLEWRCVKVTYAVSLIFRLKEYGRSVGYTRSIMLRLIRFHSFCRRFELISGTTYLRLICFSPL
jgi:hypothetical protein